MWENDDETIILLPFWWGKWWLANFVHQWILGYFWTDLSRKPHTPKRWSAGLLVQMVGRICHEVDHGHLAKRQGRTWKLFWEVRTRQNTREYWERTNQKMYLSLSYSWECHMLAMYGAISKIERTPNNWHVLNAAILKYASLNIESSENISPCCRNMLPCSIYQYHIPTSSSLNSQQYMAMFKKNYPSHIKTYFPTYVPTSFPTCQAGRHRPRRRPCMNWWSSPHVLDSSSASDLREDSLGRAPDAPGCCSWKIHEKLTDCLEILENGWKWWWKLMKSLWKILLIVTYSPKYKWF